jgi:hypothetical protein
MAFLLANSFQSSLDKLNGEEQKAAKLAAFELQINPANPGLQCHRLDNIKDNNFWSARASRDIRLIFHRVEGSVMLCYVAHPVTGAAQIVEIRETVREIQIPVHVPAERAAAPEPKRLSWTQYGVDIRGRSRTLRINYRTSHQIRSQADQLLDPESRDVDGNVQDRRGAISVFNGPDPDIRECEDIDSESEQVAAWIEQRRGEGLTPREFGIFVRSEAEIRRAEAALQLAELPYERLQPAAMRLGSKATLSTMHLAKGLEFRAVIVMACDEDVIPNDEVVATERHLLYVACTRARDHLLITSGTTCSEFVEDLS